MSTPKELIEETTELLNLAWQVQDENSPLNEQERRILLTRITALYRAWYHRGLELFTNYEQQDLGRAFIREYEGDWKTHKIQKFLSLGWQPHKVAKWVAPYDHSFKEPVYKQCDLLASLKVEANVVELKADLLLVETVCKRISYTSRILATRSRKDKPPYVITDEYDVQDLLQGVLRAHLKYSVQEDPLQKVAGARSGRADISIQELGIIIEVKYVYGPDDQKRIFDDFSKDLILYTAWPSLSTLILLVYNSANLRDLEALEKLSGVKEISGIRFETKLILA